MGDKKMERKSISKSSQRSLTLTNVESFFFFFECGIFKELSRWALCVTGENE